MATETTYSFDRSFRLKLLALCLDDEWMSRFGNFIIQPQYFETKDEEAFVQAIVDYRLQYKKSPDARDLLALLGSDHKELIIKVSKGKKSWDLKLASDLAIQFAKEQACKLVILDNLEQVQAGNIQPVMEEMKKVLQIGMEIEVPGIDVIDDVGSWLYDYWSDKVSTGWYHVDKVLEGGLSIGELGIIMAPQNAGKSMGLVNIGFGAASAFSGKNVVHFSHEMSAAQVAKRYAARISFRFPTREDNLDEYAEKLVLDAHRLLRGHIRVIRRRKHMMVTDLDNELNLLEANGFHPDLAIDDYPDLLKASRRYKDPRFELKEIYEDYRNLLEARGLPGWGATQSNRASHSKEIITMESIAEDISKAGTADVIISICRTKEEEGANMCRLFMAKVRDGKNHDLIRAKFFGGQQAIITTEFVTFRSKQEEKSV